MDVNQLHQDIYEKLAPLRSVRTRNPTHFINPRIEKIKKKRDRFYKAYKRNRDINDLLKSKQETTRLKRAINRERQIAIESKCKSPNTSSFWDFVKHLQGKNIRSPIEHIKSNNDIITDSKKIANTLANFFKYKVDTLRSNHSPIKDISMTTNLLKVRRQIEEFTAEEVINALKSYKGKMSS